MLIGYELDSHEDKRSRVWAAMKAEATMPRRMVGGRSESNGEGDEIVLTGKMNWYTLQS